MSSSRLRVGLAVTVLAVCALCCHGLKAQEPAKSLFRIVNKVVVYNKAYLELETPGVVRCKNGDLLTAFFSQGGLYTTRSKDNGLTWQKPQAVATGGLEGSVGMSTLRDGAILLPFYQDLVKEPGYQNRRITAYVYRSVDNGLTWEGDAPVDSPLRETVTYGHILQLEDGRILLPVWGAQRLGQRWQVGTLESTDEGKTWGSYRQIAYDPEAGCRPDNGFNETSIAELPDHTLLAVLRQQRVGMRGGPCDHYAEPSDHFYRAVSHDLGKSWSPPERLGLIGTSPSLHVTPDGLLMLAYRNSPQVDAPDKSLDERPQTEDGHYGLGIRVSYDQGRTWVNEFHLDDPQGLKYSAKLQPGYPDLVDLPDGNILVVFFSPQIKNGNASFYVAANILACEKGANAGH